MVERQLMTQAEVKSAIAKELYAAVKRLGGDADLLRIIGSYGDTIDDCWVLGMLRKWNAGRP